MTTLDRLRELEQAATPGPWNASMDTHPAHVARLGQWEVYGRRYVSGVVARDAALIAEARNALPALLDIAEAARAVMEEWDELGPTGTMDTVTRHHALRTALARLDEAKP